MAHPYQLRKYIQFLNCPLSVPLFDKTKSLNTMVFATSKFMRFASCPPIVQRCAELNGFHPKFLPMQETLRNFKTEFFKALAHPMRIQILEILREGERNVTELQDVLAVEGSSVSQQLSVLRSKNIVDTRKAGTNVYYSVRDPALFDLLDTARTVFNNHLIDTRSILEQLEEEA